MYSPIVGAVELISAGYQTDQSSASNNTNGNSETSPHLKAIGYLALVLDTLAAVSHSLSVQISHYCSIAQLTLSGNLLHSAKKVDFFVSSL